jgi:hypothetical protein
VPYLKYINPYYTCGINCYEWIDGNPSISVYNPTFRYHWSLIYPEQIIYRHRNRHRYRYR